MDSFTQVFFVRPSQLHYHCDPATQDHSHYAPDDPQKLAGFQLEFSSSTEGTDLIFEIPRSLWSFAALQKTLSLASSSEAVILFQIPKLTKRSKLTESSMCLYYHSWLIFLSELSQYYRNQWRCREIAMSLLKTRTSVWQRNDMDQAQQMRFSACVSVSIFRLLTKEKDFHSSARAARGIVFHVSKISAAGMTTTGGHRMDLEITKHVLACTPDLNVAHETEKI